MELKEFRTFFLFIFILVFSASGYRAYASYPCGDCDRHGDGITILDALTAAQISAGTIRSQTLQNCSCDVDGSGITTVLDALRLAQIAAGFTPAINCPASCPSADEGEAWLEGPITSVQQGQTFDLLFFLNLDQTNVGAYHFNIYYDASEFEVDTTYANNGILYDPIPSIGFVNPAIPGYLQFNGIFINPPCPSGIRSMATVRFRYIGTNPSISFGTSGTSTPLAFTDIDVETVNMVDCDVLQVGAATPRWGLSLPILTP